jgi:uncharacterized delta-60 repeat protein
MAFTLLYDVRTGHSSGINTYISRPIAEASFNQEGRMLAITNQWFVHVSPDAASALFVDDLRAHVGHTSGLTLDALAPLHNGGALLAGSIRKSETNNPGDTLNLVYRLTAEGEPDPSFGDGKGFVVSDIGDQETPVAIATTASGKIVVAGNSWKMELMPDGGAGSTNDRSLYIQRFNADGSIDTTFGKNGLLRGIEHDLFQLRSMSLQADGHILALGSIGWDGRSVLYRFDTKGNLDPSFASAGTAHLLSHTYCMALQADGKILLGGSTDGKARVVRLNADGSIDSSFGSNLASLPLQHVGEIMVRQDGSIIVAGTAANGVGSQFMAVSLEADGAVDTSFGSGGQTKVDFGNSYYVNISSLSEAPDGRLLLAGSLSPTGGGTVVEAIAVLSEGGSLDQAFGAWAPQASNNVVYHKGEPAVVLAPDLVLSGLYQPGGLVLELKRANGANGTDQFTGSGHIAIVENRVLFDGVAIGTAATVNGVLRIVTGEQASYESVIALIRSISYLNDGMTTSQALDIKWTLSQAGSTAVFTTSVQFDADLPPSWVSERIAGGPAFATPGTVKFSFVTEARTEKLSLAEQSSISAILNKVAAVTGLQFSAGGETTGNRLLIHTAAELEAGAIAWSKGHVYLGKGVVQYDMERAIGAALGLDVDGDGFNLFGVLETAALQSMYGPNASKSKGDNVYLLDAAQPNVIWDSGGTDTLSAAHQSIGVKLSLESGRWSHFGMQASDILSAGQVSINIGTAIENAIGGQGDDYLSGNDANNTLQGGRGADQLQGLGGDDRLDGQSGIDMAMYAGKRSDHSISIKNGIVTVSGSTGIDTLLEVERARFGDTHVAFDIDGNAGQLFRLYQAVFNRKPDPAGLGWWLDAVDRGTSMEAVALSFTQSAEFAKMYGAAPSNKDLLTKVYEYALHRKPDNEGFLWWLDVMDHQKASLGSVLFGFSESQENYAQVIGSMQNGIDYIAFHG